MRPLSPRTAAAACAAPPEEQRRGRPHTATVTGHGARGVSAGTVAHNLADEVDVYLQSGACIDAHLADQLLLPMALAGGGLFTTTAASDHLRSNAALIQKFLPVEIRCEELSPACWRVAVSR